VKILSPVDRPDEVEPLVAAGADELFCGLASERWIGSYPIAAVSRRSARIANLDSLERLAETARIAHANGAAISLAVNEHYYTQAQYGLLFEYLQRALETGIDSLVVADPALLLSLRGARLGAELHLSTGTTVLNSEAVRFFADLGVSRVTLERQQTISEIAALVRGAPGIETAVFVLNGRCPNVDGLCTYDHTQMPGEAYRNACMVPCKVRCHGTDPPAGELDRVAPVVRQKIWERYHMDQSPCGACALHDFDRIGVTHLKIVGRGNTTRRKIADVRFLRSLLTLVEGRTLPRARFRESARLLQAHVYRQPCSAVRCYYPELLPRARETA
jgi:putative protease